ncbi:ATP-binding protein [Streptacidiphilus anmyonensis]|uniref:ATP-binding protein n=1 Tax=Streptacidiphilus anmyonensis TaxID=405782 RepID=UPI0005A75C97|nr:ATP-binding protein [Streptacidiphilus anmyonensis]
MDTTLAVGPRHSRERAACRFAAACVLPATAASVPALRRLTRHTARRWGLPGDTAEASGLIVTELVTNAVRHSGSPDVTLLLCVARDTLTLRVKDSGRWRPRIAPPADGDRDGAGGTACGGRGLLLVEAYAASCLVRPSEGGTTVTAELLFRPPTLPGRSDPVRPSLD